MTIEMMEAVYWTADMPLLVEQRKEIPDVGSLQKPYVRYSSSGVAGAAPHWLKHESLAAQQHMQRPDLAGVDMTALPEAISMQIIRAPAEFAVPVKQDRRLKPPFKLRVTIWHRGAVNMPITVTAHAISEDEFLDLDNWIPPAIDAAVTREMVDRPTPTELKGSVQQQWVFVEQTYKVEAVAAEPAPPAAAVEPARRYDADDRFSQALGFADGMGDSLHGMVKEEGSWPDMMSELQSLVNGSGHGGSIPGALPEVYGGGAAASTSYSSHPNAAAGAHAEAAAAAADAGAAATPDSHRMVSHDFEFEKLEFAKPSRMSRVYVVFSSQVGNVDIFFTAFAVPTICFCRREQKEKAYQKLNVPYRAGAPKAVAVKVKSEAGDSRLSKRQCGVPAAAPSDPFESMIDVASASINASPSGDMWPGYQSVQYGTSQAQVLEWIEDSYHSTGLSRPLTRMDKDALLALAGFPQMGHSSNAMITNEQFAEFRDGFEQIKLLLQKINHCWIADDPHIVCGFEMDHAHAVMALHEQPPGTFLCRFSLSQPGNMVLVCKVPPCSPNADEDSLVHGLLNVNDLAERRVDVWINDFPGATHLLDVYCGKRVDKRKAFPSQYSRLRTLEQLHMYTQYGYAPEQPSQAVQSGHTVMGSAI